MKVFISWSGDYSLAVARELRGWLPLVIQTLKPFVSEDIKKGAEWRTVLKNELSISKFGIVCVTPENLDSIWMNFEAGALANRFENTYVTPILCSLKPSDIPGTHPLHTFQAAGCTRDEILKLLKSLHSVLESPVIAEDILVKSFDIWWPQLENMFKTEHEKYLASANHTQAKSRGAGEIMEDILQVVRGNERVLGEISARMQTPSNPVLPNTYFYANPTLFSGSIGKPFIHAGLETIPTLNTNQDYLRYLSKLLNQEDSVKPVIENASEYLTTVKKAVDGEVESTLNKLSKPPKNKDDGNSM